MSLTISSGGSLTLNGGSGSGTPVSGTMVGATLAITAGNVGTFQDMTGTACTCTVTVGSSGKVLISMGGYFFSASGQTTSFLSCSVSGATTRAAQTMQNDGVFVGRAAVSSNYGGSHFGQFVVSGLNPGVTTFTLKAKGESDSVGKTIEFHGRSLIVTPL